jgi:LacI family transcriptional regulator
MSGYRVAMASAGLPIEPELVREGNWEIGGGYQQARCLLGLPEPPTAIFAFNDNMAVGVLQAAREAGLEVPRDLSVVGFDDVEVSSLLVPPLTTVRQPLEEMGRVAVGLLQRLIEGQALEAARLELATRLVARSSTAPPKM